MTYKSKYIEPVAPISTGLNLNM